jgi:hypothetical protein
MHKFEQLLAICTERDKLAEALKNTQFIYISVRISACVNIKRGVVDPCALSMNSCHGRMILCLTQRVAS